MIWWAFWKISSPVEILPYDLSGNIPNNHISDEEICGGLHTTLDIVDLPNTEPREFHHLVINALSADDARDNKGYVRSSPPPCSLSMKCILLGVNLAAYLTCLLYLTSVSPTEGSWEEDQGGTPSRQRQHVGGRRRLHLQLGLGSTQSCQRGKSLRSLHSSEDCSSFSHNTIDFDRFKQGFVEN